MRYYIAGLQRSGTNYLSSLMTENFDQVSHYPAGYNIPSWKHHVEPHPELEQYLKEKEKPPKIWFFIYKNPYMWIESLCERNKVDYIQTQDMFGKANEEEHKYGKNEISIVQLSKTWNHWVKSWLIDTPSFIKNKFIINYEDLLNDAYRENLLQQVQNIGKLTRKDLNKWINISFGEVRQSPRFSLGWMTYYQEKKHKLPSNILDIINQHIEQRCFDVTGIPR